MDHAAHAFDLLRHNDDLSGYGFKGGTGHEKPEQRYDGGRSDNPIVGTLCPPLFQSLEHPVHAFPRPRPPLLRITAARARRPRNLCRIAGGKRRGLAVDVGAAGP